MWSCNDNWLDVWDCARKVRIAPHQLASRLGQPSVDALIPFSAHPSDTITVSQAISLMLRHIGMESCRLVPDFSTTVVHNLPLAFLEQCCRLLQCSLQDQAWDNAQAILVTLQVCQRREERESKVLFFLSGCFAVFSEQSENSLGEGFAS